MLCLYNHMLYFSASPFIHTIYSSHADGHPSLTLICNTTQAAHQSIESMSFRWLLPDGSARYGRILVIDNVTLQHSGKYVCITKQTIDGEKMSASSSTLITAGNDYHLGLVTTKPVFRVSDKASFKPVSSATETS